jgi:hypothetical protein
LCGFCSGGRYYGFYELRHYNYSNNFKFHDYTTNKPNHYLHYRAHYVRFNHNYGVNGFVHPNRYYLNYNANPNYTSS